MTTDLIEISEVRYDEPKFKLAARIVPNELCQPNFPEGPLQVFETADKVFVAHAGDTIIGCICLTRYQGCPDDVGNMEGWVNCWYVREEYRGKGYGMRLLLEVVKFARRHPNIYGRHIYAENKGEFLKKVNDVSRLIFVDFERRFKKYDGSTSSIYWILLT